MSIPSRMENAKILGNIGSVWWLSIIATILLSMAGLSACGKPPPEERLRARVSEMQAALVERSPDRFMQGFAMDFAGPHGMDRAAAHNMLRGQVLRNSRMSAVTGPLDISLNGDRATVRFNLVLAAGNASWLPEHAQTYRVNSGWREEDGEWRVYYAHWEPGMR